MIKSTNRKNVKRNLAVEIDETEVNIKAETTLNQQNEWQPKNWNKLLENIKQMRKLNEAAVDTMGCDQCHDKLESDPKTKRFQTLVALMLSSQTKDEITFATMTNLKENGLTVNNICAMDESEIGELIKRVGFWKTKAKNIKKVANILKDEYNGDIPKTLEDLLKLPGVGPKMALLAMNSAWNEVVGIAVDTHVHRIANRLAWVRKPTKQPEQTRKELESWLPKEYWNDINHDLVGFGQTICSAKNPSCSVCLNQNICPYTKKNN